jgi:hypothetical protein
MSPNCVDVGMDGDLAIYDAQHGARRVFKVDRVFDQHMSQQQVYEDTQPLIRSVLDGECAAVWESKHSRGQAYCRCRASVCSTAPASVFIQVVLNLAPPAICLLTPTVVDV